MDVTPQPLVELCEVEKRSYEAAAATPTDGRSWHLEFPDAAVTGELQVDTTGEGLRFTCHLRSEKKQARGMLLRFVFPFDATGWQWHDDMQTARTITEGSRYENVQPLRAYADLPEWEDQPDLRMGYSNRNFCTVLTGDVGVCLAAPMDRPCIFRTAYDGTDKRLELVYDFAFSPNAKTPNEAEFVFDLYPCSPHWGFRSALGRYYRMYPEFFKNYFGTPGQWIAFSKLSEIDNANEFYFGLQEGAPEPAYDDKIGVKSAIYLTHAGMGAHIPDYDPESDPLPPHDVLVESMEKAFQRRTGQDDMFHRVGLYDVEGKLDVRKWRVYGHLIAQYNLDPELPAGQWTLQQADARTRGMRANRGAELDGFYYDGLSSGVNYREDHFATHDGPVLWDPVAKKPFINNFFSSCEFARAAAEHLRPKGQITMMNGALHASYYVAPWLDVLGAETGIRLKREDLNYIRSITHYKPFMTLLKGNYEKIRAHEQIKQYMKRCLAYGVMPGFFDWSPSGLGPGGRYWDHSRYYERDRDLFRKYEPLCQAVAGAGWEPVTSARSSNEEVFVERFGPDRDGVVWLTLLNESARAETTRLSIASKALLLQPASVQAFDAVSESPVNLKTEGGELSAEVTVGAEDVMAIQLGSPEALARWRLRYALDTLDRGVTMREVDAGNPPVPVHWVPSGGGPEIGGGEDRTLVLRGDGEADAGCEQWVMFFQRDAEPVTLQVTASATDLKGKNACVIHCDPYWVTSDFKHREQFTFSLAEGSYENREFEFQIDVEHPLRAVRVRPSLNRSATGLVEISRLALADPSGQQYAIDPEFEQWYMPVPEAMSEPIRSRCGALRQSLTKLDEALENLRSDHTRDVLAEACRQVSELQSYVHNNNAENGCRRVLRDMETIEQHLSHIAMSVLGFKQPSIEGPMTAAPGDTIRLHFPAPQIAGAPTSTELVSDDADIEVTADGGVVHIPADAEPGETLEVRGILQAGSDNALVRVATAHAIRVVEPLTVELHIRGVDVNTGAYTLLAVAGNNRTARTPATLQITAPKGWRCEYYDALNIPDRGQQNVGVQLQPPDDAVAGTADIRAVVASEKASATDTITIIHMPPEANLLKNPGFEGGMEGWTVTNGDVTIDTENARNGDACLRLNNPKRSRSGAVQGITLNQEQPCPILVRAASRAENVSGGPGRGYSVYVDIYYTDDTPLYGQIYEFGTGTTEWQLAEYCIEPQKPIETVSVYLLLRDKSGTAYFDDVAVVEDLRRKGNLAREAAVTVDSSYSSYSAAPINDGITQTEGLHWTEAAWASAETDESHFIDFAFEKPQTVARAAIYWSLDAGIPRTSQMVHMQADTGDGFETVGTAEPDTPEPVTTIELSEPVIASGFRLLQPPGAGPMDRKNLLWVREVELLPPR
ncbi:MAG: hypothetical protein ACLFWB_02590 [Armatimonadota bacterium]